MADHKPDANVTVDPTTGCGLRLRLQPRSTCRPGSSPRRAKPLTRYQGEGFILGQKISALPSSGIGLDKLAGAVYLDIGLDKLTGAVYLAT
jgi:hypothetical protein